MPPLTLLIVGAGYSGSLLAVELLRQGKALGRPLHVLLADRHPTFGRGLAYQTQDDNYLLNVPAGNMSALADAPDHFVRYCQGVDPALHGGAFVPRRLYGDYLADTLAAAEAAHPGGLTRLSGEVVALAALATQAPGLRATLAPADRPGEPREILADGVILAPGHFPPRVPPTIPEAWRTTGRFVANPWDNRAVDLLPTDPPVLILGTGHTAVDTLFRLMSSDPGRHCVLLSRHGLLPQGHRLPTLPPTQLPTQPTSPAAGAGTPPSWLQAPERVRGCFASLRREVARVSAQGGDWRDVINALRPHTPDLWQGWSLTERRRFLRHAVAYWDIHRHRLAPGARQRLERLLTTGQVQVVAGRLTGVGSNNTEAPPTALIRLRGASQVREMAVAGIVQCTGPSYDLHQIPHTLLRSLLTTGWISPDPLGLGLRVDAAYRPLTADGQTIPGLHYLGPMLKTRYWEAIAIPELRHHARALAEKLLAS